MSERNGSRRNGQSPKDIRKFWGEDQPAEEEPVAKVRPSDEPDALVRYLGPLPLPGHEHVAQHYLAAVYDKAVALAGALAAAGGLLATDDDDTD